ncbi:MAG: hypothetical protein ACW98Y_19770 [Candidatus Thorarchaeota archaeon]
MSGEAIQSFIQVLTVSGAAVIVSLIISLARRFSSNNSKKGKPVLLAAVIFIISAILVIQVNQLPISPYQGPNALVARISSTRTFHYTVYGGDLYTEYIEVSASVVLDELERVDVIIEFLQGEVVNTSTTMYLTLGQGAPRSVSSETFFEIIPDIYDIRISYHTYYNGTLSDQWKSINVVLGQAVMPGHLEELVVWDTMRFILIVISILILIAGVIIDTETGERRRYKWYHRTHSDNRR